MASSRWDEWCKTGRNPLGITAMRPHVGPHLEADSWQPKAGSSKVLFPCDLVGASIPMPALDLDWRGLRLFLLGRRCHLRFNCDHLCLDVRMDDSQFVSFRG